MQSNSNKKANWTGERIAEHSENFNIYIYIYVKEESVGTEEYNNLKWKIQRELTD